MQLRAAARKGTTTLTLRTPDSDQSVDVASIPKTLRDLFNPEATTQLAAFRSYLEAMATSGRALAEAEVIARNTALSNLRALEAEINTALQNADTELTPVLQKKLDETQTLIRLIEGSLRSSEGIQRPQTETRAALAEGALRGEEMQPGATSRPRGRAITRTQEPQPTRALSKPTPAIPVTQITTLALKLLLTGEFKDAWKAVALWFRNQDAEVRRRFLG